MSKAKKIKTDIWWAVEVDTDRGPVLFEFKENSFRKVRAKVKDAINSIKDSYSMELRGKVFFQIGGSEEESIPYASFRKPYYRSTVVDFDVFESSGF